MFSITLARACGLSRIRPEERSPTLVELSRQHSQSGGRKTSALSCVGFKKSYLFLTGSRITKLTFHEALMIPVFPDSVLAQHYGH